MTHDDATLLRKFAATRDQPAFAEFVRRHVDLVYSSALRRCTGDSHRARDVVQEVFIAVARNAARLAEHPAPAAWLFTTTRNAAIKLVLAEQRRRARETVAMIEQLSETSEDDAPIDWSVVAPVLERALDELNDADRTAVVLRFFEQRSFAEIAAALRLKENAARMRTERALEKLRERLAARGIRSAGAALGVALAKHAVTAAPAGLAAGTVEFALGAMGAVGTVSVFAVLLQWLRGAAVSGWTWGTLVTLTAFSVGTWAWRSTAPVIPAVNVKTEPASDRPRHGGEAALTVPSARVSQVPARATDTPDRRSAVERRERTVLHPSVSGVANRKLTPAENLLRSSSEAYARLRTYQDEGEITVTADLTLGRGPAAFVTAFERTGKFFQSWSRHSFLRDERRLVGKFWSDGKTARYELSDVKSDPVILDHERGFAVLREESQVMTNRIPALLMTPAEGWALEPYRSILPLSDEVFEGVDCHRVSIQFQRGPCSELLWIGKDDFMVRRIFRIWDPALAAGAKPSTPSERTYANEIRRNIRINEPIPPGMLRATMRD